MSHWMNRVASKAGFAGADALVFEPSADLTEVWSTTSAVCGVGPKDVAEAVASAFGVQVADLSRAQPTAIRLIPGSIARKFGVFPVRDEDRHLVVATANPTNPEAEQEIGFASGRTPMLVVAPPEEILAAIESAYSAEVAAASLLERVGDEFGASADVEFETDRIDAPEEITEEETAVGPIVRLTNIVLHEAVARGASDIHIQPKGGTGIVRFRTDGVLRSGMQMPLAVLTRVVSRIKIMSNLDIADRMRPQDGRARISVGGKRYDLRVSTVPTRAAEKAVIRILDTQATGTLDDTGIVPAELERIRAALSTRDGIFIVTGPTGSGKTTTLYGALREISTEDVNIMTVEDPVEYELPGLTQIQVETKQGVTFASALRAILRQDPDVIFVGEIRDDETAGMAAQASLTGHLVLATLHTNDAVSSIRRLSDLGLDLGTIGETLRGALAQRLVRQVCPHCSVPAEEPTAAERVLEGQFECPATVRKTGCDRCVGQGYLGRIPVTEFLTPSPELLRLMLAGAPSFELQEQAERDGMRTLLQSALDRVRAGATTLEEVVRVIGHPDRRSTLADGGTAAGSPAASPDATERDSGSEPPRFPSEPTFVEPVSEDAATETDAPADTEPESEDAHVLLVDDDATVRTIARGILAKLGFTVSEVSDGSQALARLSQGEHFDLMVLDLDMPLLGGREVLKAVRASMATAALPVVVLTGTPDPDADIELMEQGADDYIRKPIDPPRFSSRVRAALRRARG